MSNNETWAAALAYSIALVIISALIAGTIAHENGKHEMQLEAATRGFGTFELDTHEFKWRTSPESRMMH